MKEVCLVSYCDSSPRSRNLCSKHYQTLRRTGELVVNESETLTVQVPSCWVEECGGKAYSGGMCVAHYMRWYKHGAPHRGRKTTTEDRFWDKVIRTEWCWLWTGNTNTYGKGVFTYDGAIKAAHRYSYMQHYGVQLEKHELLKQTCKVPECVNPKHLRLASENSR